MFLPWQVIDHMENWEKLTVSRWSSEVEYRVFAATTSELQWLLYIMKYIQVKCINSLDSYCNNPSALHIAANQVFHKRTKHLEIDCHIILEKQVAEFMKLLLVKSNDQLI